MMTEERTRFEVLLESIETKVTVIAEGHGALVSRCDTLAEGQRTLVSRCDALAEGQRTLVERCGALAEGQRTLVERCGALAEGQRTLVDRLDRMERRFESRFDELETKVDGLEVFASDAQGRLKRIETHLQLKRASRSAPRHIATSAVPSKRRRNR